MSPIIMAAAGTISVALVLYTIGVFWERSAGELRVPHVILFWAGLACDATGTTLMSAFASSTGAVGTLSVHAVTGALAFALMLFHATWATVTLARGDARMRASFHRLSIGVWLFWLLPYVYGMLQGIPALAAMGATTSLTIAAAVPLAIGSVLCVRAAMGRRRASAVMR